MTHFFSLLLAFAIFATASIQAHAQSYRDRDWNVNMEVSCGLPNKSSIQRVRINGDRKLRLSLAPGDIGKCHTDNMERHRAAYWERSEIRQDGYLSANRTYEIEWTAIFEEGYVGRLESFFQIHAWNDPCTAYPPLMMRFHRGELSVMTLQKLGSKAGQVYLSNENGQHIKVNSRRVDVSQLYGQEVRFKVIAHLARNGWVTVYVNDTIVADRARMGMAPCGKPYIKVGVYRPGPSLSNPNDRPSRTSSVVIDDLWVEAVE